MKHPNAIGEQSITLDDERIDGNGRRQSIDTGIHRPAPMPRHQPPPNPQQPTDSRPVVVLCEVTT